LYYAHILSIFVRFKQVENLSLNIIVTLEEFVWMFKKPIAIVDDEKELVNLYSEALQMSGYVVSCFSDPILAYEHIKDNPDKYSLIITDYKMPYMDGLFFATKLAEINKKLNIIIMITDHDDIKCNYKFNIIKKPVSISKLIKFVNESISISISRKNKL
jgi:DNA-binding NtrC family response regulator